MKSKDAEQALHELQELQELRDYLRFKIECRVTYYEAQVSKVDDNYLAEVAKLAKRTKDAALAYHFQQTARSNLIVSELRHIRNLLAANKLIDADHWLESLQNNLQLLEGHLRRRYLTAGLGAVSGGEKAAKARWQRITITDRDSQMREMWQRERGRGLSKAEADKKVAKKFGRGVRTVQTARLGK
jgi:hypothetical protein